MRFVVGDAPRDLRSDQDVDSRVAPGAVQFVFRQAQSARIVRDEDRPVQVGTIADQHNGLRLASVLAERITRGSERVDEGIDIDLLSPVRKERHTTSFSNPLIGTLKAQRSHAPTPLPFDRCAPSPPASQKP